MWWRPKHTTSDQLTSLYNTMASLYNATTVGILDKRIPVTEFTIRERLQQPWFDDESRSTRRQVRQLEGRFKYNKTTVARYAWRKEPRIAEYVTFQSDRLLEG